MKQTVRNSALAVVLALLTVNAGNALTHSLIFPPTHPTPDGGGGTGGTGDPNPTCLPGNCLVDIH
jgi:hypothetical protein